MSQLSFLFAGLFLLSIFLYLFFPERIKLWVILGLSSLGATLMGFWGYKDPYIIATFLVVLILSSIGALIKK
ncbi:MAG: hypothetical protein ABIL16_06525 [candidate division WOR-3 bacterium]